MRTCIAACTTLCTSVIKSSIDMNALQRSLPVMKSPMPWDEAAMHVSVLIDVDEHRRHKTSQLTSLRHRDWRGKTSKPAGGFDFQKSHKLLECAGCQTR